MKRCMHGKRIGNHCCSEYLNVCILHTYCYHCTVIFCGWFLAVVWDNCCHVHSRAVCRQTVNSDIVSRVKPVQTTLLCGLWSAADDMGHCLSFATWSVLSVVARQLADARWPRLAKKWFITNDDVTQYGMCGNDMPQYGEYEGVLIDFYCWVIVHVICTGWAKKLHIFQQTTSL